MRFRFLVIAFGFLTIFADASLAQRKCCPPTQQRLIFRLFRRASTPRVVRSTPIAVPACSTPSKAVPVESVTDSGLAASELGPITVAPTEDSSSATTVSEPTLAESKETSKSESWRSLFDGKKLGEWKSTNFGGEGTVEVEDGQIKLGFGQYMTGVTHSGKDLPKMNYEIELEARREDGSDFFCGLTFPFEDRFASFILGGWGGSVIGISSIDDMDASENSTTNYLNFKTNQWYKVRVRVTKGRLQAWIDKEMFVDEEVESEQLSTRIEMDRSQPLGVATFDTQGAVRNIRIRDVTEPADK